LNGCLRLATIYPAAFLIELLHSFVVKFITPGLQLLFNCTNFAEAIPQYSVSLRCIIQEGISKLHELSFMQD